MSGIIGGAGSKSGVIGTTELDYEEGTWTPNFTDNGQSNTAGNSVQEGFYRKIGNVVYITGKFTCTSISALNGGQDAILTGLPFTVKNATGCDSAFTIGYCAGVSITAGQSIVLNVQKNLKIAYLMKWSATGGQGFVSCTNFNNGNITWSGHYFV